MNKELIAVICLVVMTASVVPVVWLWGMLIIWVVEWFVNSGWGSVPATIFGAASVSVSCFIVLRFSFYCLTEFLDLEDE